MTEKKAETAKETPWFSIGIIVTCCLIPLLPLFFAIGSAWLSTLTAMQTLHILLLVLTLFFIGLGYRKLYLLPDRDKHQQPYVSTEIKQQRMLFWIGSILTLLILALA